MSFVAAPPVTAPPRVDRLVDSDGWWPEVDLVAFSAAVRLGPVVTANRARDALLGAIVSTCDALAAWRAAHEANDIAALEAIPGPTIGGESRALVLWRRAVYAFAAADLAETHGDIGATDAGRDRIEQRATSADEHRRNATIAIRDLLGRGRSKVALI